MEIKELLERTHGSKAPSMSFYTSPLRSKDIFLEMKELLEYITKFQGDMSWNKSSTEFQGYFSGKKAPPILHMSSEWQEDFVRNKRVIRVNPWVDLVESTTKAILHIFTEFQGHFS